MIFDKDIPIKPYPCQIWPCISVISLKSFWWKFWGQKLAIQDEHDRDLFEPEDNSFARITPKVDLKYVIVKRCSLSSLWNKWNQKSSLSAKS